MLYYLYPLLSYSLLNYLYYPLKYHHYILYKVGCTIVSIYLVYIIYIYIQHILSNKPFNYRNIFLFTLCQRSFTIQYYRYIQLVYTSYIQYIWFIRSLKENYSYQYVFYIGRSIVPPTFCRRTIGNHAQLSPTPIGNHVQLFRTHAQLYPVSALCSHLIF